MPMFISPSYANIDQALDRYVAVVSRKSDWPKSAWQALADRLKLAAIVWLYDHYSTATMVSGGSIILNSAVLDCECRAMGC